MAKRSLFVVISLFFMSTILVASGRAQENPYAIGTKVIKNEQAIQNLRQQQANLYLKMEDLLVKYGELKGKIEDMMHRLDDIESRLNTLNTKCVVQPNAPVSTVAPAVQSPSIPNNPNAPLQTKPKAPKQQMVRKNNLPAVRPKTKTTAMQQVKKTQMKKAAAKTVKQNKSTHKIIAVPPDKSAYLAARKLYDAKRYNAAINAFEDFKKQYKNSKYLPDAIFYLAQSHFNKGEYDKAIISYDYLINTYPKSDKIAGALLQEGISFIKLGDNIDGKYLLKKTIRAYPNSNEAKKAKRYLSKVK